MITLFSLCATRSYLAHCSSFSLVVLLIPHARGYQHSKQCPSFLPVKMLRSTFNPPITLVGPFVGAFVGGFVGGFAGVFVAGFTRALVGDFVSTGQSFA
jgi:hypothetical protein